MTLSKVTNSWGAISSPVRRETSPPLRRPLGTARLQRARCSQTRADAHQLPTQFSFDGHMGYFFLVLSRKSHALLQKSNIAPKSTPATHSLQLGASYILVCLPRALGYQGFGLCHHVLLGTLTHTAIKDRTGPTAALPQPLLASSCSLGPRDSWSPLIS